MLEAIINRYEVNFTTKNRINTKYYAEKKTNGNVCPKKCVTLSRLSCLITDRKTFRLKSISSNRQVPMSSVTGLTF